MRMNRLLVWSFAFLALVSTQVSCGISRVEVAVSVDNNAEEIVPRFAVTEPAWVTELLGPTETPVTTKRPSLPDRIRNTIVTGIQQVGNTINEIPTRITQIFQGIQQGGITNIIRRQNRTTSKPGTASATEAVNSTTVGTTATPA